MNQIQIGNITLDSNLILAPMAGHTNVALRRLIRKFGNCGLVYTELLSSYILDRNRTEKFDWHSTESPISVQLFGNDPQIMRNAAKIVVDNGADIVDINMGCWVPKITKQGGGAALLRDLDLAKQIISCVAESVDVPVTVKIRSGFEDGIVTAPSFAKGAEEAGAKMVAVHSRFVGQAHSGQADWAVINEVKDAVRIPVIGNGDVRSVLDAERMSAETGCDGIMIGRAMLEAPWMIQHISHYFETGTILETPSRIERAKYALELADLSLKFVPKPERQIILELRGQLSKFKLDKPGSVIIRNKIVKVTDFQDIEDILIPIIYGED